MICVLSRPFPRDHGAFNGTFKPCFLGSAPPNRKTRANLGDVESTVDVPSWIHSSPTREHLAGSSTAHGAGATTVAASDARVEGAVDDANHRRRRAFQRVERGAEGASESGRRVGSVGSVDQTVRYIVSYRYTVLHLGWWYKKSSVAGSTLSLPWSTPCRSRRSRVT